MNCKIHALSRNFLAIGTALFQIPSLITVSEYFDKKRGKAMSVTFCGPPIGGMIGALVIGKLFDYYAFSGTLLILAGIGLNICVSGMLYRPKQNEKPKIKESDEEKSLFRTIIHGIKNASVDIKLLKNPHFTVFVLFLFCLEFIQAGTQLFNYGLAKELGIERSTMANLVLITCAPDIVNRLAFGFALDRKFIRKYRSYVYAATIGYAGLLTLLVGCAKTTLIFFIFFILRALSNSMIYSQMITIITDKVDRSKVKDAIGIYRFTNSLPLLIGPVIGGKKSIKALNE